MSVRRCLAVLAAICSFLGVATVVSVTMQSARAVTGTTPGQFFSLAPSRLLDTRQGVGAPKAAVPAGSSVVLQVAGQGGVPAGGVGAVVLNVTATAGTRAGVVTVYADGSPRPTASNVNYVQGQTVPNLVVAPVGANGKVDLRVSGLGTVQLIADVSGYFLAGAPTDPGTFGSLAPARLLDTRRGVGAPQAAVPAGGVVALQVAGQGGVPAGGAGAVVLNVTATAGTSTGVVTVYADGSPRPSASNVNFVRGQTVPNLVVAPLGANGKVDLRVSGLGTVQLIADVSGYFLQGDVPRIGGLGSVAPTRLLDTRRALGVPAPAPVAAGHTVTLQVGGRAGVPGTAVSAAVLNVTVTAPTGAGVVTVYADGAPIPHASNLNFVKGQTVPNLVVAPVGANGKVDLHVSGTGAVQLIADVSGYLRDDGSMWLPPQSVDPLTGGFASVSCVSSSFCMAGDQNGKVLTYNGASWSAPVAIDPAQGGIFALSCVSATFCAAADVSREGAYKPIIYNGSTWKAAPFVEGAGVGDIACRSSTFCILVDPQGTFSRFNGTSWTSPVKIDTDGSLNSVSCASTTMCIAVDDQGRVLKYNGASWTVPSVKDANHFLSAVSCPSTSFCVAVDDSNRAITFNGSTWTAPVAYNTSTDFTIDLDCSTTSFCIAVDSGGRAFTYDGAAWSSAETVDASEFAAGLSCPTAAFCAAVTPQGSVATRVGGAWSVQHQIDPAHGYPSGVSCASAAFCAAVDATGSALTFDGTAWSAPTRIDSRIDGLTGVSCPTTAFCLAVDFDGYAFIYSAGTWSGPASMGGTTSGIRGVSCASATFCVAVDESGVAFAFDGSTWTGAVVSSDWLSGVSCPTSTFCVAAVGSDQIATYSGGSWSAPVTVAGAFGINAVSCTSTTFCVAVDGAGQASRYDGSTWSAAAVVKDQAYLNSVSCTSTTFCVAIGGTADGWLESTFDGSTWSDPALIDERKYVAAVSCVNPSFCVALDNDGGVLRTM